MMLKVLIIVVVLAVVLPTETRADCPRGSVVKGILFASLIIPLESST